MPEQEIHRDETSSASRWISPGLVHNDETVLRTVLDPHHLNGGVLAPAAISLADLQRRGWSIDRRLYTSPWRIKLFHWRWQKRRPDIHRCQVIPVLAARIRRCNADGNQIFAITDTAMCNNPAHAAVLATTQLTDGQARKARKLLLDMLPAHIDVAKTFGRKDTWGWSRGMLFKFAAPFKSVKSIILGDLHFQLSKGKRS